MTFADLTGKRIVVTGSSSGIGRAIALECAQAGADVVISYHQSHERAITVADEVQTRNRHATVLQVDVADAASRQAFAKQCFESGPVDAIVNNAGADLLTGDRKHLDYATKLQLLLDVDVTGTVELSRAFGALFRSQGHGCILNIGWDQSDRGMEGHSGELFATAKNAIMGFTRSLALSLAPDVRVNCIAPGWIKTAWGNETSDYWQQRVMHETPLKRWGLPQDIANMARYLLSDEAAYMTGQVINVNGGRGSVAESGEMQATTRPLPVEFYDRHVIQVARELIGMLLCRRSRSGLTVGRIVETEAYLAEGDSASHSWKGINRKNATMFGAPGRAYVYTIHARQCVNVVTEATGTASAVLIRAVEPLVGLELMHQRRGTDQVRDLCRGPARLCEAFQIRRNLDGWNLTKGQRLWIADNESSPDHKTSASPRIGVTSAKDLTLRFFEDKNVFVGGRRSMNQTDY